VVLKLRCCNAWVWCSCLATKTFELVLYRGWPPSEPGRQTSHPQHHQNYIHSTSTSYFSTTMGPISDAIAEIESRKPGASFSYRQLAKKYQCNQTTLSRKHQGLTDSHAGANHARANCQACANTYGLYDNIYCSAHYNQCSLIIRSFLAAWRSGCGPTS
jgi:hypothetical protein